MKQRLLTVVQEAKYVRIPYDFNRRSIAICGLIVASCSGASMSTWPCVAVIEKRFTAFSMKSACKFIRYGRWCVVGFWLVVYPFSSFGWRYGANGNPG